LLNLEKKRNTLKKLRDKGKSNFLLFIPCLIAYFFVSVYYFFALHLDMLLSDKDGHFLGIEKHGKPNKYAASAHSSNASGNRGAASGNRGAASGKRTNRGDDYTPGGSRVKTGARLVSAFLMVCFAFTFLPTLGVDFGLTLSVSAVTVGTDEYIETAQALTPEQNTGGLYEPNVYVRNDLDFQRVEINDAGVGFGNGMIIVPVKYAAGEQQTLNSAKDQYTSVQIIVTDNSLPNNDPSLPTYNAATRIADSSLTSFPGEAEITIPAESKNKTLKITIIPYYLYQGYKYKKYDRIETSEVTGTDNMPITGADGQNVTVTIPVTLAPAERTMEPVLGIEFPYAFNAEKKTSNKTGSANNSVYDASGVGATYSGTSNTATITWSTTQNATGYVIYRSTEESTDKLPIATVNGNGTTTYPTEEFASSELTTKFTYYVKAYRGITETAQTNGFDGTPEEEKYFVFSNNFSSPSDPVLTTIQTPGANSSYRNAIPITPKGYRVGWITLPKITSAPEATSDPTAAGYMVYRLPVADIISNSSSALTNSSTAEQIVDYLNSPAFTQNLMESIAGRNVFTVEKSESTYSDTNAESNILYYYAITAFRRPVGISEPVQSKPLFIPTTQVPFTDQPTAFEALPNNNQIYLKWDGVQINDDPLSPDYADSYIIDVTLLNADGTATTTTGTREVTVKPTNSSLMFDYENATPTKMKSALMIDHFFAGSNKIFITNGRRYSVKVRVNTTNATETTPIEVLVGGAPIAPVDDGSIIITPANNSITLDWEAVPEADYYEVSYGTPDPVTGQVTSWSTPVRANTNRFIHDNLASGTTYGYRITTKKLVGSSVIENGHIASTPLTSDPTPVKVGSTNTVPRPPAPAIPQPPLEIDVTAGENKADVKWSAVTGAVGYIISATGPSGSVDITRGPTTSYTHSNLTAGNWSYRVRAFILDGNTRVYSDYSDTVTVTIGGGNLPGNTGTGTQLPAPLDFLVTTTDGDAALTWKSVDGAYGYRVHASGPSGNLVFDRSAPNFNHTPLLNGEKWTYYVTALSQSGSGVIEGIPTSSYTVTIGVTLNQPRDFTFTAGNRQIDLEWSDVENAEGYIVYRYNQSLMQFEPIAVVTDAKYSATGLTNDREYSYMVAAFKTINGKQYLSQYSLTVTAKPTTGSPTDLDRKITVKGTAPYGMDRSDLMGAYANHGAFDGDVDIYIQTIDSSTEAIKNALSGFANGLSSFIIYPFDITLYQAGTYIEPVLNPGYTVTITLPIPDELVRYREYIQVMHLDDNGTLENLRSSLAEVEGTWCIQFPVLDFSPFAFVIYRDQIVDVSSGTGAFGGFASYAFGQIVNFPQAMLPFGLRIQRSKRKIYRILRIGRK
jgi:hypothetical protein